MRAPFGFRFVVCFFFFFLYLLTWSWSVRVSIHPLVVEEAGGAGPLATSMGDLLDGEEPPKNSFHVCRRSARSRLFFFIVFS
jgi:hypothetical protein